MTDLQTRLNKITSQRIINGKKLGQLLISMYEHYVNDKVKLPDTEQFNQARRAIDSKKQSDIFSMYNDIYLAIHQVRLKALDFKTQLVASVSALSKTLTVLRAGEAQNYIESYAPYIITSEEYEQLNEETKRILTTEKDAAYYYLLSDLIDSYENPCELRQSYPDYLTAEVDKLRRTSIKGSRFEGKIHKTLYQLEGGAVVSSLNTDEPEPAFKAALERTSQKCDYHDLQQYITSTKYELLYLIFGGAKDARAYIKEATNTTLDMTDKELEAALEQINRYQNHYEYILRNKNSRLVFDALGLFPHIKEIDQTEGEASMYEALCQRIGGRGETSLFTPTEEEYIAHDIEADFPELHAALERYIDELLTSDLTPLKDYMKLYLGSEHVSYTVVKQVLNNGFAVRTFRGVQQPRRDLTDLSAYSHNRDEDRKLLNALAYINSYNMLLRIIDEVYETDYKRFALIDTTFYNDLCFRFNFPLFGLYSDLSMIYLGDELEARRERIRHMFSFGYLRESTDYYPTEEAITETHDILISLRNNLNATDSLKQIETVCLYPLYLSVKL